MSTVTKGMFEASDLRDAVRKRVPADQLRIHWMAMSCIGLRPEDQMHIAPELHHIAAIAEAIGITCVPKPDAATIVILYRPKESERLLRVNRLADGCRILVHNEESDIDDMRDRVFELATACIFDRQSRKLLMVYDSLLCNGTEAKEVVRKSRHGPYIHVELSEISDSSLSIQASNIAALR